MTADKNPFLILSTGTRVVVRVEVTNREGAVICPNGAVGVVVEAPTDHTHTYRVRLLNENIIPLKRAEMVVLEDHKVEGMKQDPIADYDLWDYVVYRCVTGSRAYGLDGPNSDTDVRGVYLPPARAQWSIYGVPEQLENKDEEMCFWEFGKFIKLALKSNPNILECLFCPLVEFVAPMGQRLLDRRDIFLSKLAYQTYNGYVHAQFRKLEKSVAHQTPNWKNAMHLIRLLLSGKTLLTQGQMMVHVGDHRERLLEIKAGLWTWDQMNAWRMELHREFDAAYESCKLPERPNYEAANRLLIEARAARVAEEGDLWSDTIID